MFAFLTAVSFQSIFGPVSNSAIMAGLQLMLFGMLGIFLALGLIFLIIVVLNTVFKDKKKDSE